MSFTVGIVIVYYSSRIAIVLWMVPSFVVTTTNTYIKQFG